MNAGEGIGDRSEAADAAPFAEAGLVAFRRDRLLAALTLTAGTGLAVALPFALRAGAEFFLPVTAALVISIALVPLLELFERRGLPSRVSAALCVLFFLGIAYVAIYSIVVPAREWVSLFPQRIGQVRETLDPILRLYASLRTFIDHAVDSIARHDSGAAPRTVAVEAQNSIVDMAASAAPFALVQVFFAVLVIFFFLSGWSSMRRRTITNRGSFTSALATARVIQEVVDATSAYLGTITIINVGLGLLVTLALWWLGMPTPLMWGGLVALLNYVPYLGPICAAAMLGLGGLMSFANPGSALVPAAVFVGMHLIESNIVTPTLVGRRLTLSPLLILISLSFWGWVWGTTGALLAVPLLIITKTVLDAAGTPDIAGFLFEGGTLANPRPAEAAPVDTGVAHL